MKTKPLLTAAGILIGSLTLSGSMIYRGYTLDQFREETYRTPAVECAQNLATKKEHDIIANADDFSLESAVCAQLIEQEGPENVRLNNSMLQSYGATTECSAALSLGLLLFGTYCARKTYDHMKTKPRPYIVK